MITIIVLITQMEHQGLPAIHHLLAITIRCRCCTPVHVICDAFYPITNNITVFVLRQLSQFLLQSWKVTSVSLMWGLRTNSLPLETCQTSYRCSISGYLVLMNLLICLCRSVISMLTCMELAAKNTKALWSPSFSMWLLDFTSLLYVHVIKNKVHKFSIIILPGLIQYVKLYWYANR